MGLLVMRRTTRTRNERHDLDPKKFLALSPALSQTRRQANHRWLKAVVALMTRQVLSLHFHHQLKFQLMSQCCVMSHPGAYPEIR